MRHRLPETGVVVRYGAYKRCIDCGEDIYSEREWENSSCPGKKITPEFEAELNGFNQNKIEDQ